MTTKNVYQNNPYNDHREDIFTEYAYDEYVYDDDKKENTPKLTKTQPKKVKNRITKKDSLNYDLPDDDEEQSPGDLPERRSPQKLSSQNKKEKSFNKKTILRIKVSKKHIIACALVSLVILVIIIVLGALYFQYEEGGLSNVGDACWDSRLNDFSSQETMKINGWAFNNIGQYVENTNRNGLSSCGRGSWYGWRTPGFKGIASISVVFLGTGSATIDFENCFGTGVIDVTLINSQNNSKIQKIAKAEAMESATTTFDFRRGMTLKLSTGSPNAESGVIKIRSLKISCEKKCCKQLKIGSSDSEISQIPELMGYYMQTNQSSNGVPVWEKNNMSFLFLSKLHLWSIGKDYSTSSASIYHEYCKEGCPELCFKDWKYLIPGLQTNRTLEVACAISPELHGISNELGIAYANGENVWADSVDKFIQLPNFLNGAYYFRTELTLLDSVNNGNDYAYEHIEITVYRESAVLIYSTDSLSLQTWSSLSINSKNRVRTTSFNFHRAYMKKFDQDKVETIKIYPTSRYYRGVIFIIDSDYQDYIGHSLCSQICNENQVSEKRSCLEQYLTNPLAYNCESDHCYCREYECKGCNCTAAPLCQI